jgi:hypothetical protein
MRSSICCVILVMATTSALPHAMLARLRGGTSKEPSLLESLASLKTLLASLEVKVKVPEGPPVAPAQAGPPVLVDPSVGDMVRVRPDVKHPKFDWGDATPQSVGRLVWYLEDRCIVDFPTQDGWNGLLSEMERVEAPPASAEATEAADGAQPWSRANASEPSDAADGRRSSGGSSFARTGRPPIGGSWGMAGGFDPRRPPRMLSVGPRAAGVPTPTWLGWTLGATFASMADQSGTSGRRRRGGSGGGGGGGGGGPGAVGMRERLPETAPRDSKTSGGARDGASGDSTSPRPAPETTPETSHLPNKEVPVPKSLGVDASGRGARTPGAPFALAGLLLHVVRAASPLVGPLVYYALFTGLLLSALSIVLDQPVGTLVDNALEALPALLHALQLLPYTPTGPLVLSPLARSMLLVPLRLPSAMLAAALLYLLLVPGFDLLVRGRYGFEMGFRAVARAAPSSNAASADGTAELASNERLAAILTAWGRVIHVVQAARLTALSVAVLAVFERWSRGAQALSGGKTGLRGS